MKEFTSVPIGLGLLHAENEHCTALIWNKLARENKQPNDLWEASPIMLSNINYKLRSGSMLSCGIVEKVGDKYKLSDSTIAKCEAYLNE